MKTLTRMICQFMMIAIAMLPFQTGQASMIASDQVPSAASQADRSAVLNFLSRAETATQLQSLGLDPRTAQDRVAAMTDDEVRSVADRIQALPAGADGTVLLVLVIVFLVWWFVFRR